MDTSLFPISAAFTPDCAAASPPAEGALTCSHSVEAVSELRPDKLILTFKHIILLFVT